MAGRFFGPRDHGLTAAATCFEFKAADAPRLSDSMKAGRTDLDLDKLYLVHPGSSRHRLGEGIEGVGIERIPELCEEIRN